MIVQCPACRALVGVTQVVPVDDAHIGLHCSECQVVTSLEIRATASPPAVRKDTVSDDDKALVATPPTETKGANDDEMSAAANDVDAPVVVDAPASDAIIARVARIESTRSSFDDDGMSESRAHLFEGLKGIAANWEDKAAHRELIVKAGITDDLAFLGQCYRVLLEGSPDDKVGADLAREILIGHAMVRMGDFRAADNSLERTTRTIKVVGIGVAVIIFLVAVGFMVETMVPGAAP